MISDISLERLTADSEAYSFCEALYDRSFPENERRDFRELIAQNNDTQQSFLIHRGTEAIGYLARLNSSRYSHIIYFAIDESLQGRGIGTQVLQLLEHTPPLLPLIADLELPEDGAENYEQRCRRMQFYRRAGFTESPVQYRWRDVDWVILIRGGTISDRQFRDFWDEVVPQISAEPTDL